LKINPLSFLSYLSSVIQVSDALETELNRVITRTTASKNQFVVESGNRCHDLFFIEKGLLRGYYLHDGKEVTNWFGQEGEFATCFYAFVAEKPSFESIQVIEDCELIQLSFTNLQSLYTKFPETERLGRIITENYYIKLEERLLSLQFKTAKERYQHFVKSKPSLLQRTSLGQIASYLGITQETLSRIRAEV
jgi:CRP-like cAMP-binding protein